MTHLALFVLQDKRLPLPYALINRSNEGFHVMFVFCLEFLHHSYMHNWQCIPPWFTSFCLFCLQKVDVKIKFCIFYELWSSV